MQPEPGTSAPLATFDATLADAVAGLLHRRGIAAVTEPAGGDEVAVRVPAARRDEALGVLVAHMEEVHELVRGGADGRAPEQEEPDADEGPPIVMERLRRMGFGIGVVLAPLLLVTLGGTLPLGYALGVFVIGLAAVVYWRRRSEEDARG